MSLVLLEGPDGAGKSTVARQFMSDYIYQHNGPPPKGVASDIFWWQLAGLMPEFPQSSTVVDRSWPSEQIYHRFAARQHTFPPVIHRMFERYMLATLGVVVICLPPYDTAYQCWRKRADEGNELLINDDDFATMYTFYREWKTCLPLIHFDYTMQGSAWLRQQIYQRSKYLTKNKWPGFVTGNPGAYVLIVGDRSNTIADRPQLPFIDPEGGARWFTHELMKLGLEEDRLAFTNVFAPDNEPMDPGVLQGRSLIIALGEEAGHWAGRQAPSKTQILVLADPVYWSQYHSKETYPIHQYADMIGDAASEF